MTTATDQNQPSTTSGPGGPHPRGSRTKDHSGPDGPGPVPDQAEQGEPAVLRARYADVAGLLAGTIPGPPEPAFGTRTDGRRIFYADQVNMLFGDPESGKTWVALAASAEALNAGHRVLVIDLDHNGTASIVTRLLALGVHPETLGDLNLFRYVEPEDRNEAYAVVDDAQDWPPAVVVVDSLGELLPMFGSSSNSADDFTLVHSAVLKPLAKTGAAVLVIDHLSKGSESRAFGPGGTGAKRRAIGGSSIRVRVKDQFAPGSGGSAFRTVNKDRHGGLRQHCPSGDREPLAGTFHLRAYAGDVLHAEIEPAAKGERAPADFSIEVRNPERLTDDLTQLDKLDPPPASKRDVQDRMGWGSDRANAALGAWRERNGTSA